MKVQPRNLHRNLIAERVVKCVFCCDLIPLADALKQRGVCLLCGFEIAQLGWRTIYDRDLAIGRIPQNLRTAYNL